jgi:flagellar capping protein FliD
MSNYSVAPAAVLGGEDTAAQSNFLESRHKMATIGSVDSLLLNLAPTFQTTIKSIIEAESNPLKRVEAQKDTLDLRRSVYGDLKTNFDAFQTALQTLVSTEAAYGLGLTSQATVTPNIAGTTVLEATLDDENASLANYDFSLTSLAKAHSMAGETVASPDIALGKSGTFWMGGTGVANLQTETSPGVYEVFIATSTVNSALTNSVETGQRELGTGTYSLQVRDLNGTRQFRLVDADGQAVSIRSTDGSSSFTDSWQAMSNGYYDTGRGQAFTLDERGTLETTDFYYTAKGTSIDINSSHTQRNIVSLINDAMQPEGRDFTASIVANQLVLSGVNTGENHSMIFSDGAGLGITNTLQTASNAEFTVNGMSVSRARNTDLTNVVDGMTINLANDAEGKSARLSIGGDTSKSTGLMKTLVTKFNEMMTHLKAKLSSTSSTVDGKTNYTRGPLSGDTTFSSFRIDMMYSMGKSYENSGSFKRFEEIGLSFDDDMKLTFDADTFGNALRNNASDLKALLDEGMGAINTRLARFTGSSGVITQTLDSIESQNESYDLRITKYNESLEARKLALYKQYLEYQNQLADIGRTASLFGIGDYLDTSS